MKKKKKLRYETPHTQCGTCFWGLGGLGAWWGFLNVKSVEGDGPTSLPPSIRRLLKVCKYWQNPPSDMFANAHPQSQSRKKRDWTGGGEIGQCPDLTENFATEAGFFSSVRIGNFVHELWPWFLVSSLVSPFSVPVRWFTRTPSCFSFKLQCVGPP